MRRLILDLDGTLLDVRDRNYFSYSQALAKLPGAKPLPLEEYWSLKRSATSWPAILAKSFAEDHIVTAQDLEIFREDFRSSIETPENLIRDVPHEGVPEKLADWIKNGAELSLVTARNNEPALLAQLANLGLNSFFRDIYTTIQMKKSDFLKAHFAELKENIPRFDWWIGDTEEDQSSAQALGIKCHLVSNGMRDETFLRRLETQCSPSIVNFQF